MNEMVERVWKAIEAAICPNREGPFGGYDYSYPDEHPVDGGRYVIRDFRDPRSPDWGKWLHQTDDRAEHEGRLKQMTEDHIARAAIAAMRDLPASVFEEMAKSHFGRADVLQKFWQDVVAAAIRD